MEAGAIAVEGGPNGTWRRGHGRQPRDQRGQQLRLRARGVDLGVLGASVMGTSRAHNPMLTAQALD